MYDVATIKLSEFKMILKEFDIDLDEEMQEAVLSVMKNNQYAVEEELYNFVILRKIKQMTSEVTCQKIGKIIKTYFKHSLKT